MHEDLFVKSCNFIILQYTFPAGRLLHGSYQAISVIEHTPSTLVVSQEWNGWPA